MTLVVAFVGLSHVADKSALFVGLSLMSDGEQHIVTGTITQWGAGESITVVNQQTDPKGFEMALRRDTVYEGDTRAIKSGDGVSVWYRNVGERRPVAERVRVAHRRGTLNRARPNSKSADGQIIRRGRR